MIKHDGYYYSDGETVYQSRNIVYTTDDLESKSKALMKELQSMSTDDIEDAMSYYIVYQDTEDYAELFLHLMEQWREVVDVTGDFYRLFGI